jgi:hypothetical protein
MYYFTYASNLNRKQMADVVSTLNEEAGTKELLMVVFVHGWKHSAAPGDGNIKTFRRVLAQLAHRREVAHLHRLEVAGDLDLPAGHEPPGEVVADETAFITNIKEPWYAVVNPNLKLGFALRWELSAFPGLWFWQSYRIPDHPWFGKAYCIALEPCSGHLTAYEQLRRGTIKKLKPTLHWRQDWLPQCSPGLRK